MTTKENGVFVDVDKDTLMQSQNFGTIVSMSGVLAKHERSSRERSPKIYDDELIQMAQGYSASDTAILQKLTKAAVADRRKRSKRFYEAKNLYETTTLAILDGTVPVTTPEEPDYVPLSRMEDAVLRLTARGESISGICERYNISPNTLATYRASVKEKLGAVNNYHSLYRAFELGIFPLGQDVLDPDDYAELTTGGMAIEAYEQLLKLGELGIYASHEVEFVDLLGQLEQGWFNREIIYSMNFNKDAPSRNARAHSYGRTVLKVSAKLATGFGAEVIEKAGTKDSYQVYMFTTPIAIGRPGEMRKIEPIDKSEVFRVSKDRTNKKRNLARPKVIQVTKTASPAPSKEASIPFRSLPETLPTEALVELDAKFFKNVGLRDENEVFCNTRLKSQLLSLAHSNVFLDYQPRLIMALRYGVPLPKNYNYQLINRGDKKLKFSDIAKHLPWYRGLDIETTSQVTSYTCLEVIRAEKKFIKDYSNLVEDLNGLLPIIEASEKNYLEELG